MRTLSVVVGLLISAMPLAAHGQCAPAHIEPNPLTTLVATLRAPRPAAAARVATMPNRAASARRRHAPSPHRTTQRLTRRPDAGAPSVTRPATRKRARSHRRPLAHLASNVSRHASAPPSPAADRSCRSDTTIARRLASRAGDDAGDLEMSSPFGARLPFDLEGAPLASATSASAAPTTNPRVLAVAVIPMGTIGTTPGITAGIVFGAVVTAGSAHALWGTRPDHRGPPSSPAPGALEAEPLRPRATEPPTWPGIASDQPPEDAPATADSAALAGPPGAPDSAAGASGRGETRGAPTTVPGNGTGSAPGAPVGGIAAGSSNAGGRGGAIPRLPASPPSAGTVPPASSPPALPATSGKSAGGTTGAGAVSSSVPATGSTVPDAVESEATSLSLGLPDVPGAPARPTPVPGMPFPTMQELDAPPASPGHLTTTLPNDSVGTSAASAVPEPSTNALLASGTLLLMVATMRRPWRRGRPRR